MIDNESDYEISVKEILEELKTLIIKHNNNAKYASFYKVLFNSINYVLSITTALSLTLITLLSPTQQKELITTIIGSIFAFLVAITTKLRDNYNYDEVCVKNNLASRDYYKLKQKFGLLLITDSQTTEKMIALVELFNELKEKHNLEALPCNNCRCC